VNRLLLACAALTVLSLVLVGLLWQKLSLTQQEFARRNQDNASVAQAAREAATQAEAQAQELQARLTVAELRLSEVSLQRTQLEELMLSLSRTRDDNLVQDIESALRLALQQTQLTGSAQPLLLALQAADQRIARSAQPRLNPVQRAIARDMERIQNTALADIPALVQRLDELAHQVDEWPTLNDVGPRRAALKPRPAPGPRDVATTASLPTETVEPATDSVNPGWSRVARVWQDGWQRLWAELTLSGRELVRVSRIDQPEAALMSPEQAFFLRENVKLKLLNARLALLARHLSTSQADMAAVEQALDRYFDARSLQVSAAQKVLAQLRKDVVQSKLPRPDETLAALSVAAGGR
jgi:uroporphyrin-3 C-methyltransferase